MQKGKIRSDADLMGKNTTQTGSIWIGDDLYEKKIILDKELPIQIIINRRRNLRKKENVFPLHWHEHIEMHYIISGHMEIELNREKYEAREGDLIVVNSNMLHSGDCAGELTALVLIFRMEDLSGEFADKNIIFREYVSQDAFVQDHMIDIYEEFIQKEMGYLLVCKGKILQLITYLARNFAETILTGKENWKHLNKLERLNVIREHIQLHYMEPISNRELAKLINLSEDRFNHMFKEYMGISPLQYINEIRLSKAMNLLKTGNYSVTEVAELVGVGDYNYFGRIFRRKFGLTPTQVNEIAELYDETAEE